MGEEETSIVNYDTGQIAENYVKNTGDISRLTVSVFVDKRDSTWVGERDQKQSVKVPWTDSQMASIRSITENAVSFNPERGDKIEVVQTEFGGIGEQVGQKERLAVRATIVEGLRAIMVGIALLAGVAVFFFLLRTIVQSLDPTRITIRAEKEFEKHKTAMEEEEKAAESDRDLIVRRITKTAIENTEIAAKTLKTFFRED